MPSPSTPPASPANPAEALALRMMERADAIESGQPQDRAGLAEAQRADAAEAYALGDRRGKRRLVSRTVTRFTLTIGATKPVPKPVARPRLSVSPERIAQLEASAVDVGTGSVDALAENGGLRYVFIVHLGGGHCIGLTTTGAEKFFDPDQV